MQIIADNIKWILLLAGCLTGTMLFAALLPREALYSMFGESLQEGPPGEVVVRNWGH